MMRVNPIVTLAADVLEAVRAFAQKIEEANRKKRRRNTQGLRIPKDRSLQLRISGYSGEAALAVWLGLPPIPTHDHWKDRPDCGEWDVRTTTLSHGTLIVTPRDPAGRVMVLVIDRSPAFELAGAYRTEDARKPFWWRVERAGGGAWYVPRHELLPMESFRGQHPLPPLTAEEYERIMMGDWRNDAGEFAGWADRLAQSTRHQEEP